MTEDLIKMLEAAAPKDEPGLLEDAARLALKQGWISIQQNNHMHRLIGLGGYINAALTLVPEGLHVEMTGEQGAVHWGVRLTGKASREALGLASTAALALVIAALEARGTET